MKRHLLSAAILFQAQFISAQTYIPVDESSTVKFSVKNFGFEVEGSFKGLQGTIEFDPAKYTGAKFEVSIDASTVNTDNGMRDDHLRDNSYFDVKNHPRISFVSTKVTASNRSGTLFMFGTLDIKGIKKEISFPFTAAPVDGGFLFKGEFKINRRDFDVGGASTIANSVTIFLNVVAKK
ncbi:MAG: YceI family protein [Bacteroidetes bacterium]|nr:YceI family protein [Bacteroidota bacterium]MBS1973753.1 YceI family protein [Bacteroidota bacterium]